MKNISYTINTTITPTTKTPQINQIITALTALFPNTSFTLEDTKAMVDHGLVTKQDPRRIFAYYQNDLIAMGFLTKDVTTTESTKPLSKIAQIRELATKIANDVAISDESRAAANAIIDLLK